MSHTIIYHVVCHTHSFPFNSISCKYIRYDLYHSSSICSYSQGSNRSTKFIKAQEKLFVVGTNLLDFCKFMGYFAHKCEIWRGYLLICVKKSKKNNSKLENKKLPPMTYVAVPHRQSMATSCWLKDDASWGGKLTSV